MNTITKLITAPCLILPSLLLIFSLPAAAQPTETGIAVFYADYLHGQSTALGEIYNKYELTCAHRTYPLGSLLRVTRLDTKQSVTVRVNDRGPYAEGLLIDLSWAAAKQIGLIRSGKAKVQVQKIGYSATNPHNPNKPTGDKYKYAGNPAFSDSNTEFTARGATSVKKKKKKGDNTFDPGEVRLFPKGQTGYAIQVASYSDYSNAQRFVIGLQSKGVEHLYLKREKALYKVIIAPFNQKVNAMNYLENVRRQYELDGLVIMLRD